MLVLCCLEQNYHLHLTLFHWVIHVLEKMTLHASIKLLEIWFFLFLMTGTFCDYLQCKGSAFSIKKLCLLQSFSIVDQYFMMDDSFFGLCLLKSKICRTILYSIFHYQHSYLSSKWIHMLVALIFLIPMSLFVVVPSASICSFSCIMICSAFLLLYHLSLPDDPCISNKLSYYGISFQFSGQPQHNIVF